MLDKGIGKNMIVGQHLCLSCNRFWLKKTCMEYRGCTNQPMNCPICYGGQLSKDWEFIDEFDCYVKEVLDAG